jgi:hypothetical protein
MYVTYTGPRRAEEVRDPAFGSAIVFERGKPGEIDDEVGKTLVRRKHWEKASPPAGANKQAPAEPPLWSLGRTAVNQKAAAMGISEPETMKDKAAVIAEIEKTQAAASGDGEAEAPAPEPKSRKELNAIAASLGVENAEGMANKDEVIAAIEAAEAGKGGDQ